MAYFIQVKAAGSDSWVAFTRPVFDSSLAAQKHIDETIIPSELVQNEPKKPAFRVEQEEACELEYLKWFHSHSEQDSQISLHRKFEDSVGKKVPVLRVGIIKAQDYLFAVYSNEGEDEDQICIVSREHWAKRKCIDDQSFDGIINSILPPGFAEASESTFHYYGGTLSEGIAALKAAGFEQITDEDKP